MLSAIIELGKVLIGGITGYFERKQKIENAVAENRARLALSQNEANHEWEMKQLANSGYKDDLLFYAIIGLFVWSAFDPDGASRVFNVWETTMPDWLIQITGWLVASVIGVRKLGDNLPSLIQGVRSAWKGADTYLGGIDALINLDAPKGDGATGDNLKNM